MMSARNFLSRNDSAFKFVLKQKMLELDVLRIVAVLQMIESMILDIGEELRKVRSWFFLVMKSGNLWLRILWLIVHLAVSIWYFLLGIVQSFESFLIATDALKKYEALDISKVRYLAVVIDSEEARQISKVFELLQWLVDIGVTSVCLYDPEGVLKKYKEAITERFSTAKVSEEASINDPLVTGRNLNMEFISFADGKEAVAKAANFLFAKHYLNGSKERPDFTEPQMGEALGAIGCGGPEPDLLLIYGPTRCHLGFPAWRLRYTEIVHMGQLKSMKYGALVKGIYRYTMVHQNYGNDFLNSPMDFSSANCTLYLCMNAIRKVVRFLYAEYKDLNHLP